MRVTVFGASGKTGRHVVKRLLGDGHEVVAFIHKSSPFKDDEHLVLIQGDIHDIGNVRQAVKDSEAVISALGSWGTKSKDIVSSGTENIIAAMSERGTKRIVSLTGSDAAASGDRSNILGRMLHFLIKLSPAHKILADGEKHIKLLENSELDWTVLRSPVMNNKGDVGDFTVSTIKPGLWQTVNRQSVANALVDLLEGENYHKQAPYIKRGKA